MPSKNPYRPPSDVPKETEAEDKPQEKSDDPKHLVLVSVAAIIALVSLVLMILL